METLRIIVNIVLILASIVVITVVLMQQTKSGGLGSAFGGDTASFAPSRAKAVSKEQKLQKITIVGGCLIAAIAIAMMIIG